VTSPFIASLPFPLGWRVVEKFNIFARVSCPSCIVSFSAINFLPYDSQNPVTATSAEIESTYCFILPYKAISYRSLINNLLRHTSKIFKQCSFQALFFSNKAVFSKIYILVVFLKYEIKRNIGRSITNETVNNYCL